MKPTPRLVALVFTGGVIGALGRWVAGFDMEPLMALFLVNTLGSIVLGYVNVHPYFKSDNAKAFWAIGFAGGFTTMSGVALWLYAQQVAGGFGSWGWVMLMFILGILGYRVGLWAGNR